MRGTLAEGDGLWVHAAPWESLEIGDVVAFRSGGKVLAHRIVGRDGNCFRMQGDGNWRRDSSRLSPGDVMGKVVEREHGGGRLAVAGGRRGRRRADILHAVSFIRWSLLALLAPAYRLIRASRVVSLLWKPRILVVHFPGGQGGITKFIHRGRTAAAWEPHAGQWKCRKPYDLVLSPPRR